MSLLVDLTWLRTTTRPSVRTSLASDDSSGPLGERTIGSGMAATFSTRRSAARGRISVCPYGSASAPRTPHDLAAGPGRGDVGRKPNDHPAGRIRDREERRRADPTGLGGDDATDRDDRADGHRPGRPMARASADWLGVALGIGVGASVGVALGTGVGVGSAVGPGDGSAVGVGTGVAAGFGVGSSVGVVSCRSAGAVTYSRYPDVPTPSCRAGRADRRRHDRARRHGPAREGRRRDDDADRTRTVVDRKGGAVDKRFAGPRDRTPCFDPGAFEGSVEAPVKARTAVGTPGSPSTTIAASLVRRVRWA